MKFSEVVKGTRAEREAELPGVLTQSGKPVVFLLRPLNDEEEVAVIAKAEAYARSQGAEPREGSPLFDRTVMVETLLLGCLDVDSPKDSRAPFFESEKQISKALDRDAIALLYQMHQAFQSEVSPFARHLSAEQLYAVALEVAAKDTPDPFVRLAPGTQWRSFRTLAMLLIGSPEHRSLFGLPSHASPTTPASSDPDA